MKQPNLELDYVVPVRRPVWLGLLVLAIALGAATDLALRYRQARNMLAQIETAQGLLNTDRRPAKSVSPARLDEQIRAAETIVRQLTMPWAALIVTLETLAAKDVAVLQIQPETQQRIVRITAEARDSDAMLQYLLNLSASSTFDDVHLLNHQIQPDDPTKPLQFSVQAALKATP